MYSIIWLYPQLFTQIPCESCDRVHQAAYFVANVFKETLLSSIQQSFMRVYCFSGAYTLIGRDKINKHVNK